MFNPTHSRIMIKKTFPPFFLTTLFISCLYTLVTGSGDIILKENWQIQSSINILEGGDIISRPGYRPESWYPISMPSTVLAALVENKVYPDPYYGTNIRSLPGFFEGRGKHMSEDSPFRVSWWYRTVFPIPNEFTGKHIWLIFHSINYRANIYGFRQLGVRHLLSISAVGSMREDIRPGDMVLPTQFIDRTRRRESTFFSWAA